MFFMSSVVSPSVRTVVTDRTRFFLPFSFEVGSELDWHLESSCLSFPRSRMTLPYSKTLMEEKIDQNRQDDFSGKEDTWALTTGCSKPALPGETPDLLQKEAEQGTERLCGSRPQLPRVRKELILAKASLVAFRPFNKAGSFKSSGKLLFFVAATFFLVLLFYEFFFACAYSLCTVCVCSAQGSLKRASDPLTQELEMSVSYSVGAGN